MKKLSSVLIYGLISIFAISGCTSGGEKETSSSEQGSSSDTSSDYSSEISSEEEPISLTLEEFAEEVLKTKELVSPYNVADVDYKASQEERLRPRDMNIKYLLTEGEWKTYYGISTYVGFSYYLETKMYDLFEKAEGEWEHMVSYSLSKSSVGYEVSADLYDQLVKVDFNVYGDITYFEIISLDEYQIEQNYQKAWITYSTEEDKTIYADILAIKDMYFEYNSENNTYTFLGFNQHIKPAQIRIPGIYDDGTHGQTIVKTADLFSIYRSNSVISVTLGANVDEVIHSSYYGDECQFSVIFVNENNKTFASYCEVLFSYNLEKVILCPPTWGAGLSLPYETKTIGEGAFYCCSHLEEVKLNDNLTEIGDYAFMNSSIEEMIIPDSVTKIGGCAFMGCQRLKEVKLGNSINAIYGSIFNRCSSLEKIVFGNGLRYISLQAFELCKNINNISYAGTIEEWKQIQLRGEWEDEVIQNNPVVHCTDGDTPLTNGW